MRRNLRLSSQIPAISACLLLAACGGATDGTTVGSNPELKEPTASATLALTNMPRDAQCLRIRVTIGAATTDQLFPLAINASTASLPLGLLPPGPVTFHGDAFPVTCDQIGTSTANWIADPLAMTLQTGMVNVINLTFRRNDPVAGRANFIETITDYAPGPLATYYVTADGSVLASGNSWIANTLAPTRVAALGSTVVEVSATSPSHACVRTTGGLVRCWGTNVYGELGATAGSSVVTTLQTVPSLPTATQISVGLNHTCALTKTAPGDSPPNTTQVWCWGSNQLGELSTSQTLGGPAGPSGPPPGPPNSTSTPVAFELTAGDLSSADNLVARVVAGEGRTCVVLVNGTVACAGKNALGQLGTGTTDDAPIAQTIPNFTGVKDLALGKRHSCALTADGSVWCWGAGPAAGTASTPLLSPTLVVLPLLTGRATHIAASAMGTCARTESGAVYCWGETPTTGTGSNSSVIASPTLVIGAQGVLSIKGSGLGTLQGADTISGPFVGLLPDRSFLAWGPNGSGAVGSGVRDWALVPTPVKL